MEHCLLNKWRFFYGNEPEAFQKDFDDSGWRTVNVPHDWSVDMPFSKNNSSGTGYLSGGTAWYRTSFTLREESLSKRVFLQFDGVYKNSQVWCNGYYLGLRPSGYAGFCYDVTHAIAKNPGAENVISVKVRHEDIADSRWFTGSGLYRKVSVLVDEAVYLPQDGILFTGAPQLDASGKPTEQADISITAEVVNTLPQAASVAVKATLATQKDTCLQLQQTVQVPAGATVVATLTGVLENAQLWSPEAPNLYLLAMGCTATGQGQAAVESLSMPIPVGVRGIRFDADKGFFLNGESRKIKGVCVHHDAGCLGAAVYPQVWRRRLEKLKAAGCNAIRMSHNPHMPELYALCDEMGFFAMDECFDEWEGPKNKWACGHNVYPPSHQGYAEDFPQWHEADLAAMVRQNRNHASIIMWSVGNEIDYPNDPYCHPLFEEMTGNNDANKPSAERQYNPNKPNAERLVPLGAQLVAIVKKHDTTRPVLIASAFPELSAETGLFAAFDVMGYNYKEHLYAKDHQRFPSLPFLGSENSHNTDAWLAVRDNEYISAQFLWTGIDYLGEAHGWPVHGSPAGILDMGGFEKPAFFRRKTMWLNEPSAWLGTRLAPQDPTNAPQPWDLCHVWNGMPGTAMEAVCYTNLDEAELFCGDKSLGKKARPQNSEYITWTLPFARETLRVAATGGSQLPGAPAATCEDSLAPAMPAVQLAVNAWQPQQAPAWFVMPQHPALHQVEITLLDENGQPCPQECPLLQVTVQGGTLLGLENGDVGDTTEYSANYRHAANGRLIAYVLPDEPAANGGAVATSVTVSGAEWHRVWHSSVSPVTIQL